MSAISISEFEQAQTCYEKKNYLKAKQILSKLYLQKQTLRTNYMLFQTLVAIADYSAAYQLASDYLNDYLARNGWFKQYLQVGVKAGQNIKLWQLVSQISPYLNEAEQTLVVKTLLETGEDTQLSKSFSHLGAFELKQQRRIYQDAYSLAKEVWLQGVIPILVDQDVHPLIRNTALSDLQKLAYSKPVKIRTFFEEELELVPSQLVAFEDDPVVQAQEQLFTKKVNKGKLDALWQQAELKLVLMLLYPDFTKVKNLLGDYQQWYYLLVDENSKATLEKQVMILRKKVEKSLATWEKAWQ